VAEAAPALDATAGVLPGPATAGAALTGPPAAIIEACFGELEANRPADEVLAKLRGIDAAALDPVLHARLLQVRAIATNRLGFSGDALGDLHEAAGILEQQGDGIRLAGLFRTIALVYTWRAQSREAALALLRAIAEAPDEGAEVSLSLLEAARLQMEIGHPRDACALFMRALKSGAASLPAHEQQRAAVHFLQALVACGDLEGAGAQQRAFDGVLTDWPVRLRILAHIELARMRKQTRDFAGAAAALQAAADLAPGDPDAFERVEIAHARAETIQAEGDPAAAVALWKDVIARYADDDLASREVVARLMCADALDASGAPDEADRMLAAAQRRAGERGLSGYADQARSRIAQRGTSAAAWQVGEPPIAPPNPSSEDRFVRRRAVGAGGFASVVRAYDLELGAEVALKRSALRDLYDTVTRARLLEAARTEAQAAARIEHPGVAKIHGLLLEPEGDALLVEEFIDGPSLREAMAKAIDPTRGLALLAKIAFALSAIHGAGILHRDLKPENILLRSGDAPVVVDFGIALLGGRRGAKAGTANYMSPEQARNSALDGRTDLYALGVMAHEILVGTLPPPAASDVVSSLWTIERLRRRLTATGMQPDLARLLASLLSPHRRWRPSSAAAVGRDFAAAAAASLASARAK
jgi:tetratricopeptide (TPR) repeat protein